MDATCDFRQWDELIPDTLGLIFRKLPLAEILNVIPRVCKSWARVVKGPYCWQEIDIEEWSQQCGPENLDRMLQMLILRSCGSLQKLCVYGLSTSTCLYFIANNAKSLQNLKLPRSEISDLIAEQIAGRLSNLTSLDLSYCTKAGAPALEAFGRNCKLLTSLLRNMQPWDTIDRLSQDDEAFAIAATMPKLKHLELAFLLVSTEGVFNILTNCNELELLDVTGCWNVKLDEKLHQKFSRLRIVGPPITDQGEKKGWDECSEYSGSSSYSAWDFVAGDMGYFDDEISDGDWEYDQDMEDLELMFFDGIGIDEAQFDWPPSP
ncbi:hypothetical protein Ancab_003435 [Ancistrocladus abbreviatus]